MVKATKNQDHKWPRPTRPERTPILPTYFNKCQVEKSFLWKGNSKNINERIGCWCVHLARNHSCLCHCVNWFFIAHHWPMTLNYSHGTDNMPHLSSLSKSKFVRHMQFTIEWDIWEIAGLSPVVTASLWWPYGILARVIIFLQDYWLCRRLTFYSFVVHCGNWPHIRGSCVHLPIHSPRAQIRSSHQNWRGFKTDDGQFLQNGTAWDRMWDGAPSTRVIEIMWLCCI